MCQCWFVCFLALVLSELNFTSYVYFWYIINYNITFPHSLELKLICLEEVRKLKLIRKHLNQTMWKIETLTSENPNPDVCGNWKNRDKLITLIVISSIWMYRITIKNRMVQVGFFVLIFSFGFCFLWWYYITLLREEVRCAPEKVVQTVYRILYY